MVYIGVVDGQGTQYQTNDRIGSAAEREYFRVMTEDYGKLYFHSEDSYHQWCTTSRESTDRRGGFVAGRPYATAPVVEGTNADEFVIIEEYVVEENGTVV